MDVIGLVSIVTLVGILNIVDNVVEGLAGPYGVAAAAAAGILVLCTFTTSCPVSALARRFCVGLGCRPA